jgi:p21-activated kinase 1
VGISIIAFALHIYTDIISRPIGDTPANADQEHSKALPGRVHGRPDEAGAPAISFAMPFNASYHSNVSSASRSPSVATGTGSISDKASASSHLHNSNSSYAARGPSIDSSRPSATATPRGYQPRLSFSQRTSNEFMGQRFDSAAVISNLEAACQSADQSFTQSLQASATSSRAPSVTALPQAPRLQYSYSTGAAPTVTSPSLTQSLAATGRKMDDIAPLQNDANGARDPKQRNSDEAVKENKFMKRKTGFTNFMTGLISTPRRPAISAPENPVHVTHVGYDQETGEFTVSPTWRSPLRRRPVIGMLSRSC